MTYKRKIMSTPIYDVAIYNNISHKWKVIGTYRISDSRLSEFKHVVGKSFKDYKSKAITKIRVRRLR